MDGVNESRWAERVMNLRNMAQQCYLLICLTSDSNLKDHLLEIGLGLEHLIRSVESETECPSDGSGARKHALPRRTPQSGNRT